MAGSQRVNLTGTAGTDSPEFQCLGRLASRKSEVHVDLLPLVMCIAFSLTVSEAHISSTHVQQQSSCFTNT